MVILRKILRIIFWALALWIITRVFIFQVCRVPTASMRNRLLEGDYIYVNKLAYGSRLPITPLSVRFGNEHFYLDWLHLPFYRLPGYSKVALNNIVVFNLPTDNDELPVDEKKEYVKRCMGLPGDTITIRRGNVVINGRAVEEAGTVLKWYSLPGKSPGLFITAQQVDSFKQQHVTIFQQHIPATSYSPSMYPYASQIKWNADSLGPLHIPKRGQSMRLTQTNLLLYQRLIEVYERKTLSFRNDSVFVNGAYASDYTFDMDYYYMMGDNRYNSIDSRYWGLVPEDHIIGKVAGSDH